jgi:hypothetical protein
MHLCLNWDFLSNKMSYLLPFLVSKNIWYRIMAELLFYHLLLYMSVEGIWYHPGSWSSSRRKISTIGFYIVDWFASLSTVMLILSNANPKHSFIVFKNKYTQKNSYQLMMRFPEKFCYCSVKNERKEMLLRMRG